MRGGDHNDLLMTMPVVFYGIENWFEFRILVKLNKKWEFTKLMNFIAISSDLRF